MTLKERLVGTVGWCAVAFALATGSASAATCDAVVVTGIDPHAGCYVGEDGVGGSGNDSAALLNAVIPDGLFGLDTWEFIAKDNDLDGTDEGVASAMTVTGSLITGTITLADTIFDLYDHIAIVLKSGRGLDPEFWVAYKAVDGVFEYDYTSIFVNKKGEIGALSHISLYGTPATDMPPVPLPAAGWMLIAGIGGLAALRRRKRA